MSKFVILLGGPLTIYPRLLDQVAGARAIAADGGIRHAEALGLTPEIWVGDFDSTDGELALQYAEVPRLEYPAEKALTDGELALRMVLEEGGSDIIMVGALGGERADHAWAHVVQALALAMEGRRVFLTSGAEEGYPLLPGRIKIDLPKASMFSVLGLDRLEGLTIQNARYPLEGFELPFGSSRTISNVAEGEVTFDLRVGRALVLARPHDFSGV
jgi:thiamine pyrophosphokinase